MSEHLNHIVSNRPRFVDIHLLEELKALRSFVDEAIISVHRINALNTAGGKIVPWTEEQFDFVERERLAPIGRMARTVAPDPHV